jgi:hypothetical protein
MVRPPLHHALDTMSITPSKALLDALLPAKVRNSPAVTQAPSVARAKPVEQSGAVPGALKPGPVTQQGSGRPIRRGAILDISV